MLSIFTTLTRTLHKRTNVIYVNEKNKYYVSPKIKIEEFHFIQTWPEWREHRIRRPNVSVLYSSREGSLEPSPWSRQWTMVPEPPTLRALRCLNLKTRKINVKNQGSLSQHYWKLRNRTKVSYLYCKSLSLEKCTWKIVNYCTKDEKMT